MERTGVKMNYIFDWFRKQYCLTVKELQFRSGFSPMPVNSSFRIWNGRYLLALAVALIYNISQDIIHSLTILLFGLCADLAIVGLVKGIVRRPRPPHDIKDQVYEAPVVDKYSFPSGHSSRSAMLAVLCLNLCSLPEFICAFVKIFPFVQGASRILMGRHYVGDVLAGLLLGYTEGNLVQYLPMCTVDMLKETFSIFIRQDVYDA